MFLSVRMHQVYCRRDEVTVRIYEKGDAVHGYDKRKHKLDGNGVEPVVCESVLT